MPTITSIHTANIDKLTSKKLYEKQYVNNPESNQLILFQNLRLIIMFKYEEYDIDKRLSYFIKKLWILDNLAGDTPVTGKSVLPNGCFNIAVIEGHGLIVNHQGRDLHLTQGSYFCGQMTEAISVTIINGSKATMIQLHAWVPIHFSSVDMYQFHDHIVPFELTGIDSDVIRRLPRQSNQLICQNIILVFAPQLIASASSKIIYLSTSTLMDNKGNYTIEKLAADLNCSLRYLQKMFKKTCRTISQTVCGHCKITFRNRWDCVSATSPIVINYSRNR